jgi:hypothetical protein
MALRVDALRYDGTNIHLQAGGQIGEVYRLYSASNLLDEAPWTYVETLTCTTGVLDHVHAPLEDEGYLKIERVVTP